MYAFGSIGTVFSTVPIVALPAVKVTSDSWGDPCTFVVVAAVALGVTPTTFGLNVAVAGVPFLSLRTIDTGVASPLNVGSGVNVTSPLSSTV